MSRILVLTSGLTGIVNASMELSNRLQKAGHEVLNSSFRNNLDVMKVNGFNWHYLPEVKQNTTPRLPNHIENAGRIKKWCYKYYNRKARQEEALNAAIPLALKELIENYKPDLVFCDVELHEYIILLYSMNTRFILLSQWFNLYERKGLPYLLTDTIPGVDQEGSKEAMTQAWSIMKAKRAIMFKNQAIKSRFTDRASVLQKMREKYKFPDKYVGQSSWPAPYLYEGLPMVSMTMQELEFPFENQSWHTYLGPMVYAARQSSINNKDETDCISELQQARSNGQKIICCTVSTMHTGSIDFIKKVVEVAKRNVKWSIFIGLGGKVSAESLGELPKNCIVQNYIPQIKVLSVADCSINHGGIHTINECIHYGVPMLVYSGQVSDQNGCGARVQYHKVGMMADRNLDSAEQIANKLDVIMNESIYKSNIGKIQEIYQSDIYIDAFRELLSHSLSI